MILKIDKAGRVVLPKPVRDRLGLHEGSDLELEETSEGVMLKPMEACPSMVKKQGLWVHTGDVPPRFDVIRAVRNDREDRIRRVVVGVTVVSRKNRPIVSFRARRPLQGSRIDLSE